LNVCLSVALALLAFGMVNYIGWKYYARWDVGRSDYYQLSNKTLSMIRHLSDDVKVVAFVQKSFWIHDEIQTLLQEYEYAGRRLTTPRLEVRFIDPDRELALARDMAARYDVHGANVVVFECQGRRKVVEAQSIADTEYTLKASGGLEKRMVGFRAEEAFSSAILCVSQSASPIVYFLRGHGERDVQDFTDQFGYSGVGRALRRDNMEVRALLLAEHGGVPADCSVLVIAGPEQKLPAAEVELIAGYLSRNGRLMVLLDPGVRTGIEPLLEEWGVKLSTDVVVGLTLTGRELVVSDYGEHPITKGLMRTATLFYSPRSVEQRDPGSDREGAVDRPRVTPLAMNTAEGWAEADLKQHPPKFDAAVDRRGPVSVAVAVEKGPSSAIRTGLKPARLVVIGDSFFVANGALSKGAGGNKDLFLSSMNWLIERETLLAIGPKKPGVWSLNMDRRVSRTAYLVIVGAVPGVMALLGLMVWARRRK
jgi:ABC-type uncharacterized transport system involved in gliding motility auxiliary subunit